MTINSLSSATAILQTAAYGSLNKSSQTAQAAGTRQDGAQISDLGELMKQLEELQQSDPARFKKVTAEVSKQLEAAAKDAGDSGDTRQAGMFNDLAAKFKTASETGEMPDLQPSQDAHGRRGHGGGPPPMGPPPDSDDDDSSIAQLLKQFQQTQSADPMSVLSDIIKDALSSQT